jgi:hypothetical protein
VINSIENLNSTIDLLQRAKRAGFNQGRELISIALAELDDSFDVLREGHVHRDARGEILVATANSSSAFIQINLIIRNAELDDAIDFSQRAISRMRF